MLSNPHFNTIIIGLKVAATNRQFKSKLEFIEIKISSAVVLITWWWLMNCRIGIWVLPLNGIN